MTEPLANVPAQLRERAQWVPWRYEQRNGNKPTKVPCNVRTGVPADATDPAIWITFDQAVAALTRFDGIGYAFSPDDPYCGIDLDACIAAGQLHPAADAIVKAFASWTERTPSGEGLHIIIQAELHCDRHRVRAAEWSGEIEVYDRARFFTVTGEGKGQVAARQQQLDGFVAKIFPPKASASGSASNGGHTLDDRELLELARNASNGRDFAAIYDNGRHSYPSASEADAGLCMRLAYWTKRDAAQIDRLYRGSALMRAKWDDPRGDSTYGWQTIESAIAACERIYEPREDRRTDGPSASSEDKSSGPRDMLDQSRVDLITRIEEGIAPREYVPGTGDTIARAKRVHLAAEAKSGKSIAFLVTAVDTVAAGGTVVILDRENGPDETARRLECILDARDADDDLRRACRERLRYHAWPTLRLAWRDDHEYVDAFAGVDLVIFDSSRSHLTPLGLKENESDDFAAFTIALIDPLMQAGISTLVPDNVGHEAKDRARGTIAKQDLADIVYTLRTVTPFSESVPGRIELTCQRSRIGEITTGDVWELELGGGH